MKYEDMKSIGGKTRFVFDSPPWYIGAPIVALLSSMFGLMIFGWGTNAAIRGFLLLGLPAYASVLLSLGYARLVNTVYWAKTDLLISMASIVLSAIIFSIGYLINLAFPMNSGYILIVSLTVPIWIRHVYMSAITITGQRKALPLSITYPAMIFLSLYIFFPEMSELLSFFLASSAASIFFSAVFLASMDAPMRHVLGVGGLEFTLWTVEHYKERSRKGHDELEAIFDRFGEAGVIKFDTLSFVRDGEVKGALLVHTAHPGPVGDVGGGDLPTKLAVTAGIENMMNPHGASTHDMNPTTEKEAKKLGKAIKKAIPGEKTGVSKPVRVKEGDVSILAQRFGDLLMIIETSYPHGTEDIDTGIALALEEKVKQVGYKGLMFIDAHNCFDSTVGETRIQSPRYGSLEKGVMKAAYALKDAELFRASVGFGQDRSLEMKHGVARLGVQAMVIEAGGKRTAYVLLDGNNMVKGLRERIISGFGADYDHMEVMTTDNHYVNLVSGGKNPVGNHGMHDEIVASCGRALRMAEKEVAPAEVHVSGGSVEIRIFGPNRSAYMYCVPRSIDGMGRYAALLSLLGLILTDVLLAMLI